ncbi:PAS domain-containing protein [Hymenobacter swuensis]|uniref:histidine kinase n=1 Tax=Hymenobacter swuensis DY53 TaxID=1227739 RepID=W8F1E9_9BACT|nr:PAS domain-containing protein [Hymenobacter swuensis]AHJ97847.1 histidine kinase [Hymenobacter swuensis DY53]
MPASLVPLPLRSLPAADLLGDLLAVSMTGIIYYTPIYDPAGSGQIVDFTFVYLNPTAQRMMRMPEVPTLTHNEQWPHSIAHGTFDFHVDAYLSGEPREYNINYQADGYDNYYRLAARRTGDGLWVSFTDTADQPRSPVEMALRESQAREKAARAEAEAQRQRLHQILMELPASVATLHGPDRMFTLVSPGYQQLFASRVLQDRPLREALPELVGQPHLAALDQVYQSGAPYYGTEIETWVDFAGTGQRQRRYFNVFFQALRDATGTVDGVLSFAYDVTEQLEARHQLQQLNQELESRVQERTQQLRGEQQRLQLILRQVPAFIATLEGPEHRHTFFNTSYGRWSDERAQLGRTMAEVYPETVDQGFIGLLDEVYRTGRPFVGDEVPVQLAAGASGQLQQYYLDFIYQPLLDERGQTTGILAFIVDATEKVRARQQTEALQTELLLVAQRQVREREAFYQVFEQTPALIALLRAPEHRIEYANPAYQQVFAGRPLQGLTLAEALPELVDQGFTDLMDRVYQTGETYFGTDTPFTQPATETQPARTIYYNFTYQAYQDNGQIAGITVFAYDVTEQVLAHRERDSQQQRLEQLFMQAPAAISILVGPDMVYELVNPGYQAMFPGRELRGRAIADVFPELAGTGVLETFEQVYRTGVTNEEKGIRIYFTNPDTGQLEDRYFNYIQQARRDAHGQPDGVLVFAFEVTEQVRARQQAQALAAELTLTNDQLTRTNADLDNFIYTASHDLKAPISNIEGLLYLLQEELPAAVTQGPDVAPTLTRMLGAVERFKRTIEHLTEVSKLQKEHEPAATAVDLAEVVEDVRQDLLPLVQETGARLHLNVAARPPIRFSEKNLRSVVYNLLSNALKYHSPARRPHIDVRAHVRPGYTVLEVHDNGLGIEAAYLPRLFTMFQRFHDHVEGSGIGLYMVKRMVDNAGGRIEVFSQPGAGTTFFVHLPQAAEVPAS